MYDSSLDVHLLEMQNLDKKLYVAKQKHYSYYTA
jgi:hypothetical protein